jgi:hypothetical protein
VLLAGLGLAALLLLLTGLVQALVQAQVQVLPLLLLTVLVLALALAKVLVPAPGALAMEVVKLALAPAPLQAAGRPGQAARAGLARRPGPLLTRRRRQVLLQPAHRHRPRAPPRRWRSASQWRLLRWCPGRAQGTAAWR